MVSLIRIQFLLVLLLESVALAHVPKGGDIRASTGPFGFQTHTREKIDDDTPRLGWGLIAQGDVDQNGGVEIGLIYVDKTYVRTQDQNVLAERIKRMYVTTGYRHWFFAPFSAGLAIFSSYAMGDVKTVFARGTTDELRTTAHKLAEYGLDLSLQWEIFATETLAIVADARYGKSFSAKKDEDADQYGGMLALKYLLQKPQR